MAHVFLVVSPDPDAARMLRGLVESMGHVAWEAPSLDDARAALARGAFCGIVLDVAVDEPEEPPRRGARRPPAALGELRARDPRRTDDGAFVLPILVLAADDLSVEDTDALYASGASAVVRKPLAPKRELLGRKIDALLRRAGRADHTVCGVTAARIPSRGVHLELTGERKRGRTGLRANGRSGDVQNGHFVPLLRMAIAKTRRRGGWSARHQLGITRNPEVPSRLRAALKALMPEGYEPLEGDWGGSFRLNPEMTVEIDLDALDDHPLASVKKIVKDERELRAKKRGKRGA